MLIRRNTVSEFNEHSADRFQEVAKPEFMLISSEMVPIVITRNLIILN